MQNLTASELAGFGVGAFLLWATISAPRIDAFISASQRSSLGMCKRCGDLKIIACSRCKGVGSVSAGGPFSFKLLEDFFQLSGDRARVRSVPCTKCRAKGHFSCPDCSKLTKVGPL
ncbi:uncharacterized protein LOC131157674 [Malania oleifera]|uniref:uncharacterized protein LOC131157674 n=1 Tax=Malania oleifera TaxID=397392 RepID=UPI0025ADD9FE|nr:uncharacterized protein LOC131157674 [Malania oleifera]